LDNDETPVTRDDDLAFVLKADAAGALREFGGSLREAAGLCDSELIYLRNDLSRSDGIKRAISGYQTLLPFLDGEFWNDIVMVEAVAIGAKWKKIGSLIASVLGNFDNVMDVDRQFVRAERVSAFESSFGENLFADRFGNRRSHASTLQQNHTTKATEKITSETLTLQTIRSALKTPDRPAPETFH
jgi:hypothetical protein